jgi:two-component system response regulator PilR (NtrC family)
VREKRFREDLFYRLQVIPVHAPPLRERREDIPLLADYFLQRLARAMGKHVVKVSDEAMAILKRYAWPGNVRELENVMERAVALETTEAVLPERLPDGIRSPAAPGAAVTLGPGFDLEAHLSAIEARLLQQALAQSAGDRGGASELLGITPRQLRYLLHKHALSSDKNWQA